MMLILSDVIELSNGTLVKQKIRNIFDYLTTNSVFALRHTKLDYSAHL